MSGSFLLWAATPPAGVILTVSSTQTNYNLFTAAGSPVNPINLIVNINSGVTIGGTGSSTALTVGQFPTGSTITINNNGNIDGFGGAAGTSGAGGNGGDAINANYPNQTVIINNNVGANIRGGGGGGGKGGTGGTGGAGQISGSVGAGCYGVNNQSGYNAACQANGFSTCSSGGFGIFSKACYYSVIVGCTNCTSSTSGGAGGAGGNGGAGQGYSQAQVNGSAGAAGSAGGTNAGTGGTGGTGGNGGTFGNSGTAGATGSTGASGNVGSGSAGSAGSGAGTAGRYLVKGSSNVTLNNSGTVAGGLA